MKYYNSNKNTTQNKLKTALPQDTRGDVARCTPARHQGRCRQVHSRNTPGVISPGAQSREKNNEKEKKMEIMLVK